MVAVQISKCISLDINNTFIDLKPEEGIRVFIKKDNDAGNISRNLDFPNNDGLPDTSDQGSTSKDRDETSPDYEDFEDWPQEDPSHGEFLYQYPMVDYREVNNADVPAPGYQRQEIDLPGSYPMIESSYLRPLGTNSLQFRGLNQQINPSSTSRKEKEPFVNRGGPLSFNNPYIEFHNHRRVYPPEFNPRNNWEGDPAFPGFDLTNPIISPAQPFDATQVKGTPLKDSRLGYWPAFPGRGFARELYQGFPGDPMRMHIPSADFARSPYTDSVNYLGDLGTEHRGFSHNVMPYFPHPQFLTMTNQSLSSKMERAYRTYPLNGIVSAMKKNRNCKKKCGFLSSFDSPSGNADTAPQSLPLPNSIVDIKKAQMQVLQNLSKLKAMIHMAEEDRRAQVHKREEARRSFLSQLAEELQMMSSAKVAQLSAAKSYTNLAKVEKGLASVNKRIHSLMEQEDQLYQELTDAEARLANADMGYIPKISSEQDLHDFASYLNFAF